MGRSPGVAAALFYGAVAALVLLGVRDVLFVYEENRCSMTYMYEYPEYLVSAGPPGRGAGYFSEGARPPCSPGRPPRWV